MVLFIDNVCLSKKFQTRFRVLSTSDRSSKLATTKSNFRSKQAKFSFVGKLFTISINIMTSCLENMTENVLSYNLRHDGMLCAVE